MPTFAEAGHAPLTMSEMFVVAASSKLPASVQQQLAAALSAAVGSVTMKATLRAAEFEPLSMPQDAIVARVDSEHHH